MSSCLLRKGQVSSVVGRLMDVLIVGSVAYDSVVSPLGHVKDALGGSATYALSLIHISEPTRPY